MCDFWENFIIGFLSGGLSSLAVTFVWSWFEKKRYNKITDMEQERQYKFDFANDIQLICKYLGRLQLELNFEETADKSQNIMRMLEAHPSTPSFKKGLNEKGSSYLTELWNIKNNIEDDIKNKKLNDTQCEKHRRELFKLECEILRDQNIIRKTWEEVKTEN